MSTSFSRAVDRLVYRIVALSTLAAIVVAAVRPDGVFGGMFIGGVL